MWASSLAMVDGCVMAAGDLMDIGMRRHLQHEVEEERCSAVVDVVESVTQSVSSCLLVWCRWWNCTVEEAAATVGTGWYTRV